MPFHHNLKDFDIQNKALEQNFNFRRFLARRR